MVDRKPRLKYRCVEVIAPAKGCEAARLLKNTRLLTVEAPRLPLSNCDRPADCQCIYRHFDDRRQGPRRDNEHARLPLVHTGPERRRRLGRRDTDYV